nr:MAG TPA: hypothetical protein [Caudoviricetes sp.]
MSEEFEVNACKVEQVIRDMTGDLPPECLCAMCEAKGICELFKYGKNLLNADYHKMQYFLDEALWKEAIWKRVMANWQTKTVKEVAFRVESRLAYNADDDKFTKKDIIAMMKEILKEYGI